MHCATADILSKTFNFHIHGGRAFGSSQSNNSGAERKKLIIGHREDFDAQVLFTKGRRGGMLWLSSSSPLLRIQYLHGIFGIDVTCSTPNCRGSHKVPRVQTRGQQNVAPTNMRLARAGCIPHSFQSLLRAEYTQIRAEGHLAHCPSHEKQL